MLIVGAFCKIVLLLFLRLLLIVSPLARETVMVIVCGLTINGHTVEWLMHLLSSSPPPTNEISDWPALPPRRPPDEERNLELSKG
jgi:hypothetical protein